MYRFKLFVSRWLLPSGLTAILGKMLLKTHGFRLSNKSRPRCIELDFDHLLKFGNRDNISRIPIKNLRYQGGRSFLINQHVFMKFFRDGELALSRFYEMHQPKNALEEHFIYNKAHIQSPPPLGLLPWFSHKEEYSGEGGLSGSHGHQAYGPVSSEKLSLEAERLTNVLRSIINYGYLPEKFDGYPRGYLLVDDNNSPATQRFLITGGQHRVAALCHLGFSEIFVTFEGWVPRQVKISQINEWPGVTSGIFSNELAYEIFHSYFRDENINLLEK
jgi:hypothetical protein